MSTRLELIWLGVPVTVVGDISKPQKATEIDPPEPMGIEIEQVLVGGVDILPILECMKAMQMIVSVDAIELLEEHCLVQLEHAV